MESGTAVRLDTRSSTPASLKFGTAHGFDFGMKRDRSILVCLMRSLTPALLVSGAALLISVGRNTLLT